jgi:hypothetical protein
VVANNEREDTIDCQFILTGAPASVMQYTYDNGEIEQAKDLNALSRPYCTYELVLGIGNGLRKVIHAAQLSDM